MAEDSSASPGAFPPTRLSVLVDARAGDPSVRARSLDILAQGYWAPVYKYLRLRWKKPSSEAEELTQSFFLAAVEKDFFSGYEPSKARFRTFLRVCVDRFASDEHKASRRLKRGGGASPLSFDVVSAESEIAHSSPGDDVEKLFDREFRRSLFSIAVESLRTELTSKGREKHFRVFERYDLTPGESRPSYDALGQELGMKTTDVTYSLHFARQAFRRHVLERLRELTVDDEEFEIEARSLGVGKGP